jgi:hypothetical protein
MTYLCNICQQAAFQNETPLWRELTMLAPHGKKRSVRGDEREFDA